MKVFLDTSALFAMLVKNDYMYIRAKDTFLKLMDRKDRLFTTNYVLLETLALLQARVSLEAARLFHHEFLPVISVVWIDESLHEAAFRRLELRGKHNLSLVDCASFVCMEKEAISCVFAYDEHFAGEGFTVIGKPDDLDIIPAV